MALTVSPLVSVTLYQNLSKDIYGKQDIYVHQKCFITPSDKIMLPIKYDCTIIADIKRPDVQGRNFRIPVQILMNIKDRNITGKSSSPLGRKERMNEPCQ
jgi:hypothetical protein